MATAATMATTTVSTDTPRQDAARDNARSLDELRTSVGRRQRMRIGLFIPCYIDAFFPEVGIATIELLERFGHDVEYPHDQTCCGQPMANSGFNAEAAGTEALFVRNFSGFDSKVEGIEFVQPARPDECCGFGGTFSVFEEVVSTKMGYDKVRDHAQAGAEYIVSADSSCLMHQQGCAERIGVPMKFIHIAQILNGAIA